MMSVIMMDWIQDYCVLSSTLLDFRYAELPGGARGSLAVTVLGEGVDVEGMMHDEF